MRSDVRIDDFDEVNNFIARLDSVDNPPRLPVPDAPPSGGLLGGRKISLLCSTMEGRAVRDVMRDKVFEKPICTLLNARRNEADGWAKEVFSTLPGRTACLLQRRVYGNAKRTPR